MDKRRRLESGWSKGTEVRILPAPPVTISDFRFQIADLMASKSEIINPKSEILGGVA